MRTCRTCSETFPLEQFDLRNGGGHRTVCRECRNAERRQIRHTHRDRPTPTPNYATRREVFAAYDLLPPEEELVNECLDAYRVHIEYASQRKTGMRPSTPTPDDIMRSAGLGWSNWLRIASAVVECHRIETATVENVRRSA